MAGSLGTVCVPDGDETFYYDLTWPADSGCNDYTNTATFTTNDTEATGSDDATVTICREIFKVETAWAANGNAPWQLPYNVANKKTRNWATYVNYKYAADGSARAYPFTTTLFAGQTMPVGTVTFSACGADAVNKVTISVSLDSPWEFAMMSGALKVQDYKTAPSGNPSPGLFAWKANATGTSASIQVKCNNFYGVQADVGRWILP